MQLIKGDCIEEMAKLEPGSIDLILTDPPYGMDFQSNHRIEKHRKIQNDSDLHWVNAFVEAIYRLAANDCAVYSYCSFHKMDVFKQAYERLFKIKNCLVWEKNNTSMGDLKGDFAPKVEFIILATKGRPIIRGKRDPNIFKFSRTGNKLHPTQKPVDMIEYLISKFSDIGQTVLDPFMGSGSTGIACANTGRNFIGIEKDDKFFEIAKQRIKQHGS